MTQQLLSSFRGQESRITREAQLCLDRICPALNVKVTFTIREDLEDSYCDFKTNHITLGVKNHLYDLAFCRDLLTHECIHALGIYHGNHSRSLGFYSSKSRDSLTPKVMNWIFHGKERPQELNLLVKK